MTKAKKQSKGSSSHRSSRSRHPVTATKTLPTITINNNSAARAASQASSDKIRRPCNAFMLYRKDIQPILREQDKGLETTKSSKDYSLQVSQLWRDETPQVKARYQAMAFELREALKREHPEYKYSKKAHKLFSEPSSESARMARTRLRSETPDLSLIEPQSSRRNDVDLYEVYEVIDGCPEVIEVIDDPEVYEGHADRDIEEYSLVSDEGMSPYLTGTSQPQHWFPTPCPSRATSPTREDAMPPLVLTSPEPRVTENDSIYSFMDAAEDAISAESQDQWQVNFANKPYNVQHFQCQATSMESVLKAFNVAKSTLLGQTTMEPEVTSSGRFLTVDTACLPGSSNSTKSPAKATPTVMLTGALLTPSFFEGFWKFDLKTGASPSKTLNTDVTIKNKKDNVSNFEQDPPKKHRRPSFLRPKLDINAAARAFMSGGRPSAVLFKGAGWDQLKANSPLSDFFADINESHRPSPTVAFVQASPGPKTASSVFDFFVFSPK